MSVEAVDVHWAELNRISSSLQDSSLQDFGIREFGFHSHGFRKLHRRSTPLLFPQSVAYNTSVGGCILVRTTRFAWNRYPRSSLAKPVSADLASRPFIAGSDPDRCHGGNRIRRRLNLLPRQAEPPIMGTDGTQFRPRHIANYRRLKPIDHQIVRNDAAEIIFQLDIYQLTVPFGAISSNARFWKHVDEDHVDLATHALLLKNGVRFGIGPTSEWTYFKSLIDQYGASARKGSIAPIKKGSIELPMASNIREQNIFFFREPHDLSGRSYEKRPTTRFLSVTFEPTPRHHGDARIEACALVRGLLRSAIRR